MRWTHLARHGLLSTSLVGAASAPASAEPCGGYADLDNTYVGFVLGVDLTPKFSLFGGLEVRTCMTDIVEGMVRVEIGTVGARLIGGARVRPFEDSDRPDDALELLGAEAGLAIDLAGDFALHGALTLGPGHNYLGAQGMFALSADSNVERKRRGSLVLGYAPWVYRDDNAGPGVPGRPLSRDGRLLAPEVIARCEPPSAEDRAVRDHFTHAARLEYSSVWTFLRLAAELVAVGAPAALVARALDAADDEVRHAELCARAAGGLALAPLSMLAAQPRFTARSPRALAMLAAEAWSEGCLNEGAAAQEARLASAEAQGPTREMLATIARDEATHAALAWDVLAWVFSIAPEVARTSASSSTHGNVTATDDDPALVRRGVASAGVRTAAWADVQVHASRRLRERFG